MHKPAVLHISLWECTRVASWQLLANAPMNFRRAGGVSLRFSEVRSRASYRASSIQHVSRVGPNRRLTPPARLYLAVQAG
jgi:hypothetical protein